MPETLYIFYTACIVPLILNIVMPHAWILINVMCCNKWYSRLWITITENDKMAHLQVPLITLMIISSLVTAVKVLPPVKPTLSLCWSMTGDLLILLPAKLKQVGYSTYLRTWWANGSLACSIQRTCQWIEALTHVQAFCRSRRPLYTACWLCCWLLERFI